MTTRARPTAVRRPHTPRSRTGPPTRRDPRRPGRLRFPYTPPELQPHRWFAQRLVLTLSGQKPVHWMLGHTVGEAYEQLLALADTLPLRGPMRAAVRKCEGAQPSPDVIEAFARVAVGDRVQALAFRLQLGPDRRWRCAAVEVGPRTDPAAAARTG